MPDRTPDRLKEFREEYAEEGKGGPGWARAQFAVVVVGMGAILLVQLTNFSGLAPDTALGASRNAAAHHQRELATRLADKGLTRDAIAAYDRYLAGYDLPDETRAKVCYSVAELAIGTGDYTAALARLYESELLDPDSSLKQTINQKIVFCLERLGRTASLRRELRERSRVGKPAADSEGGDTILAEFGDEVILRRDLERKLDELPAAARKTMGSAEAMGDFLRTMVGERLLLEKARRLELDKDSEIQELLSKQLDSLILRKLIDDEIKSKLEISEGDVERFYKAEIQRFTRPPSARGVLGMGSSDEAARSAAAGEEAARVAIGPGRVNGVDLDAEDAASLSEAILDLEAGDVSYASQIGDTYYVFKGALRAAVVEPLENIRGRVERLYRMEKEQEALDSLMESTLRAQNARLYLDRLDVEEGE